MAACVTLGRGRALACKGGNGGIKAVGIAVWSEANKVTGVSGEVATLPVALTAVYRYQLKNSGNSFTEEIVADSEARTVLYNGTVALVLQKLDLDTRNEIALLAMTEVVLFIETNNGEVFVVGSENGAELTGGNFMTGGARGDMSGSNLTFTSTEPAPHRRLSTAAKATYAGIVVNGI